MPKQPQDLRLELWPRGWLRPRICNLTYLDDCQTKGRNPNKSNEIIPPAGGAKGDNPKPEQLQTWAGGLGANTERLQPHTTPLGGG